MRVVTDNDDWEKMCTIMALQQARISDSYSMKDIVHLLDIINRAPSLASQGGKVTMSALDMVDDIIDHAAGRRTRVYPYFYLTGKAEEKEMALPAERFRELISKRQDRMRKIGNGKPWSCFSLYGDVNMEVVNIAISATYVATQLCGKAVQITKGTVTPLRSRV